MDVVKIVDAAIERLPEGEHSQGLKAIKRHIGAAIRHFERGDTGDFDTFTDAIYRTNQAFEGGLKEAYRVLASKDPIKLSPFEIENYLEKNKLIRPRVLKQLTRYREDYRNPSTHDHKLDFDADEALLAIVSVCAFTKLLVNQMASKFAFEAASSLPPQKNVNLSGDKDEIIELILRVLGSALSRMDVSLMGGDELDGFVNGALVANGLTTQARLDYQGDEDSSRMWDILVSSDKFKIPIEVRLIGRSDMEQTIQYIKEETVAQGLSDAILLMVPDLASREKFIVYHLFLDDEIMVHILSTEDVLEKLKPKDVKVLSRMKSTG